MTCLQSRSRGCGGWAERVGDALPGLPAFPGFQSPSGCCAGRLQQTRGWPAVSTTNPRGSHSRLLAWPLHQEPLAPARTGKPEGNYSEITKTWGKGALAIWQKNRSFLFTYFQSLHFILFLFFNGVDYFYPATFCRMPLQSRDATRLARRKKARFWMGPFEESEVSFMTLCIRELLEEEEEPLTPGTTPGPLPQRALHAGRTRKSKSHRQNMSNFSWTFSFYLLKVLLQIFLVTNKYVHQNVIREFGII